MLFRNKCPLCQYENKEIIYQLAIDNQFEKFFKDFYKKDIGLFKQYLQNYINYVKCKNCNLIYQENILSDSGMYELYENIINYVDSLNKRLNFSLQHHKKLINLLYKLLKLVNKNPSEMIIVDFGMGFGNILSYTKALGCINSYGIELSDIRIKYAKENYGIKSFNSLEKFEDESIDMLIANQTLEHIPDLRLTLDIIEKKIAKGGIVYIAVPDGSKKMIFLSKGAFQPLEHINSFIPNSKNFLFSSNMKYRFILQNLNPNNKTTWVFQKL